MANLRRLYQTVVSLVTEVQAEMHALQDRARAGQPVAWSAMQACTLGLPPIKATLAGLAEALRTGAATPRDSTVLLETMRRDLRLLLRVLRGDVGLSETRNN